MTESYEGRVLVGIIHPMAYPKCISGEGPIVETLRSIALDDFFSAVEVRRCVSSEVRDEVARVIAESGMEVVIAGQPPLLVGKLNLNSLDQQERASAVADVKASIDEAYAIGARIVAVLSGPDPGEAEREAALGALAKSLTEAGEYAVAKSGGADPVFVSLETFDNKVDKKCLIGPTDVAAKLMARVKESVSNVGLTVDLSHLPLLGETAEEMLEGAREHLIHVHVGNAYTALETDPAYGDQHPRFGYPGSLNDVTDLAEFLGVLRRIGYFDAKVPTRKPVISFEIKPVPGEDAELIIANAKRVWREAWAMA